MVRKGINMGYTGNSMSDLNGFNLASNNVMPANNSMSVNNVMSTNNSMPVNNTMSGSNITQNNVTQTNNAEVKKDNLQSFQPSYSDNEYMKPGSVKISSVYESEVNKNNDNNSPYAQSNKNDIIPKKDIEEADNRVKEFRSEPVPSTMSRPVSINNEPVKGSNIGFGVVGDSKSTSVNKGSSYKDLMSQEAKECDEKRLKELKRLQPLPVWRWMFTIIGLSIPGLNVLLVIIWALFKTNRSRQNLCRAIIFLFMILGGGVCGLLYFVGMEDVVKTIQDFMVEYKITDYLNDFINSMN